MYCSTSSVGCSNTLPSGCTAQTPSPSALPPTSTLPSSQGWLLSPLLSATAGGSSTSAPTCCSISSTISSSLFAMSSGWSNSIFCSPSTSNPTGRSSSLSPVVSSSSLPSDGSTSFCCSCWLSPLVFPSVALSTDCGEFFGMFSDGGLTSGILSSITTSSCTSSSMCGVGSCNLSSSVHCVGCSSYLCSSIGQDSGGVLI